MRISESSIRARRQLYAQTAIRVLHDLEQNICRAAGCKNNGKCVGIVKREDDRLGTVRFARRAVAGAGVREGELRGDGRRKVTLLVRDHPQGKWHAFGDGIHRHFHAEREL